MTEKQSRQTSLGSLPAYRSKDWFDNDHRRTHQTRAALDNNEMWTRLP